MQLEQALADEHFKTDCLTLATLIKLVCLPEPLSLVDAFKLCKGCRDLHISENQPAVFLLGY